MGTRSQNANYENKSIAFISHLLHFHIFLSAVAIFLSCHDNLFLALSLFLLIQGAHSIPTNREGEIFPCLQWTPDQISHFLRLPCPLRPQPSHFTLDNVVFTNGCFLTMKISLFFFMMKAMPAPLFTSYLANSQELSKSGTLQEIDWLDECSMSHSGWGHSLKYFPQ